MSLPHFGNSGFDGSLAHGFLQHALMFMVFFVVEKYVLFDPMQIGMFCFEGILFRTNSFTDSIEKFIRFWIHSY